MTELRPSLRRAFLASPHHAVMALATLGAGFVSGEPLYLLLGSTAYILGWLYLPDAQFFQRWLARRREAADADAARAEIAGFIKKRDALLGSLPANLRERYHTLSQVCRAIENAAASGSGAAAEPAPAPLASSASINSVRSCARSSSFAQ